MSEEGASHWGDCRELGLTVFPRGTGEPALTIEGRLVPVTTNGQVVLADETLVERSRIADADRDTFSEKSRRFLEQGMLGLVDGHTTTGQGRHRYNASAFKTLRRSWS
jgi:hypothetical protein